MTLRENWERLADVWEERAMIEAGDADPYAVVSIDAIPLDDEMSILDIGCGPGVSTIALAQRAGPNATVTGIDVAHKMILHARERVRRTVMQGEITPHNIVLRQADAETDDLGTGHHVIYSRFGLMFFDDPKTGFANLARSLRVDGWLSFVAWAGVEHNPWITIPPRSAAGVFDTTTEPPQDGVPGPFGLADADLTTELLAGTGFDRVRVVDVTQPRRVKHGSERRWIALALRTGPLNDHFETADSDQRDAAIDTALAALERFREPGPTGDWLLPAHARVFIARRA